jgi:tRNA U34 5-carboxymethylaminomethyl modifying GTPase MnmE/TrmE
MSLPNFNIIHSAFDISKSVLSKWTPTAKFELLDETIRSKSESMTPRIMVYGIYNAGKSTLLNALMGRSAAAMSDRPETTKVTPYAWNGFTLYDTPGIDAPKKDEAVAREQIERCDVVLFVVSTKGTTEEQAVWDEILKLVGNKRQVVLIVNNRSGFEINSVEQIQINEKILRNLQVASKKIHSNDKWNEIKVMWIDAKTALRGREENKQTLVEASGIVELENGLTDFLNSCDANTVFESCKADLIKNINDAETAISQKSNSEQATQLDALKMTASNEQSRLKLVLNEALEAILLDAKNSMSSMVTGKEDISNAVNIVNSQIFDSFNKVFTSEYEKTKHILNVINTDIELERINVAATVSHDDTDQMVSENASATMLAQEGLQKIITNNPLVEKGALAVLEKGKDILPVLFKGIGAKTMAKYAGVFSKALGPIVSLGFAVFELWRSGKADEEQKRQFEIMAHQLNQAILQCISDFRNGYKKSVDSMITNIFKSTVDQISLSTNELHKNNADIQHDLAVLSQAKTILN